MTEFQNRLIDAGVTAGVEVMVQTLAPKEAAEAVIALGATPVFVDSEPQTGRCMQNSFVMVFVAALLRRAKCLRQ